MTLFASLGLRGLGKTNISCAEALQDKRSTKGYGDENGKLSRY